MPTIQMGKGERAKVLVSESKAVAVLSLVESVEGGQSRLECIWSRNNWLLSVGTSVHWAT